MNAILIAGPTASGKSSIAVELAKKIKGAVINVDSMQVYRELKILTARPETALVGEVPHFLYGHVEIKTPYSVAQWLIDVKQVLENCKERELIPILVGGTGLYFKGLLNGLSEIPPVKQVIRDKWRNCAKSNAELFSILQREDSDYATSLNSSDRQRVLRALEVIESSGESLTYWQKQKSVPLLISRNCVKIVLFSQRHWLKTRINLRFDEMINAGAIEEAKLVENQQLSEANPALKAIGLRPLRAYLRGELNLDSAIEKCKIETHQYAKRQDTWFRNQMEDWIRINSEEVSTRDICAQINHEFNQLNYID